MDRKRDKLGGRKQFFMKKRIKSMMDADHVELHAKGVAI